MIRISKGRKMKLVWMKTIAKGVRARVFMARGWNGIRIGGRGIRSHPESLWCPVNNNFVGH